MPDKRFILKRHRFAAIIVVVAIVVLCALLAAYVLGFWSIDRQLAAIEAAEGIPDSDNAAIEYVAFGRSYAHPPKRPSFLDPNAEGLTRVGPWTSEEYPELAAMLEDYQEGIEGLFAIAVTEKCRFPIPHDPDAILSPDHPIPCVTQWVFLLTRGLNQDLGEGRIQEAAKKYACLAKIADHFRQQPAVFYHNVGLYLEWVFPHGVKNFVVTGDVTSEQLSTLRSVMQPTQDTWSDDYKRLKKVEDLLDRKRWRRIDLITKVKGLIERSVPQGGLSQGRFDSTETIYYRQLTDRRGIYILIALRQYKNETGRWPESLDVIRESLTDEILTDPHNGGPFLYELTNDGFRLMSTGRNRIDECGDYKTGDDWPIWPHYSNWPKP